MQLTSLRVIVTIQDINTSSLACEHRVLDGVDIDEVLACWERRRKEEGEFSFIAKAFS